MPIRSINGSRPGRGSSIARWLDLQSPGAEGERRPVYVNGEICVARFTGSTWSLVAPSAPAQAFAVANPMPPGAVVIPSIYAYQTGLEIAHYAVNDGSAWFAPAVAARASAWELTNPSGRNANKITILIPNAINLPSSVRVTVATGGGGYDGGIFTSIQTVPILAGGADAFSRCSIATITIDLPSTVAAGGRVLLRVESGAGLPWTASSSAGAPADPISYGASPSFANAGQDLVGAWSAFMPGLGMGLVGVQWHTIGNPILRILHTGDSVGVGVSPLDDPNPADRTSWLRGVNAAEAGFGQRFVAGSIGNGGMPFFSYMNRFEHLVDTAPEMLRSICEIFMPQMTTWNYVPADGATALAMRDHYYAVAAKAAAIGIVTIPLILTPPGAGRQTAGHLEQYGLMRTWVASEGGIDMADLIEDPATPSLLDPIKSFDGVHIDTNDGVAFGTAAHPRFVAAIAAKGMI